MPKKIRSKRSDMKVRVYAAFKCLAVRAESARVAILSVQQLKN